jgi:hypothetical protein
MVGTRLIRFFVEPTRPDWFYPCSIDDICAVLAHCSSDEVLAFDFIVMRQPTRKQRILCPVWGRAIFSFDIDKYSGSAIVIEAQDLSPVEWRSSIDPERKRELDRLRQDEHEIHNTPRGVEIRVTRNSLRNTVLYRTLLHELGHQSGAAKLEQRKKIMHIGMHSNCMNGYRSKVRCPSLRSLTTNPSFRTD